MPCAEGVYTFAATAIAGVLHAGLALWWGTKAPETQAQTSCKDADLPESYDFSLIDMGGKIRLDYEVSGKMNRMVMPSGREIIYDGQDTRYIRLPGWKLYEKEKTTTPHKLHVSEGPFPQGRATLCPDAAELGAEYVETDSTGKRYVIDKEDKEEESEDITYWTDDDGWLVQADTLRPYHVRVTFSGIGEPNKIEIPDPPYWKLGDPPQ